MMDERWHKVADEGPPTQADWNQVSDGVTVWLQFRSGTAGWEPDLGWCPDCNGSGFRRRGGQAGYP